ncbi:MAG: peptidoglycan-binding protein [Candidatus Omnitrophica bacterium]|nr:peptidoglycan-binding protein [Candidatus Omnitrophota bacterium]
MKRSYVFVLLVLFFTCGCNIVPKSVQYQKEEEKVIGSVDTINPLVEEIQVALDNLGYETDATDGRMGQKTREAIKEFQESMGIKSTGYVNQKTWRQIEDIRRASEEKETKEFAGKIKVRSAYSEIPGAVASSDTGKPTEKEIQKALKGAGFDPGAVDGKMGPRTQQAIKEFQRTKGLKIDGKVGPKTWVELKKYLK